MSLFSRAKPKVKILGTKAGKCPEAKAGRHVIPADSNLPSFCLLCLQRMEKRVET